MLERPTKISDTIGFGNPDRDTDAYAIHEFVSKLKEVETQTVNFFTIAVNTQNRRLDKSLQHYRIFPKKMVSNSFWQLTEIVSTKLAIGNLSSVNR